MAIEWRPLSVGLLGIGITIFFTIFYLDGWMWGQNAYAAPFFIALTARAAWSIRRIETARKPENNGIENSD
jgi:hypothetical protein